MAAVALGAERRLTVGEVARLLVCSRWTVRRLAEDGRLPSHRLTPTSPRLFRIADLLDFIAERASASAPVKEDS